MKKLIILSFCLLIGSAYAQQFTASLSKKTVATNETFRVDFKLEGGRAMTLICLKSRISK